MTPHQTPPSVTDEMVEAALAHYRGEIAVGSHVSAMRSALTAALAAMPGGVDVKAVVMQAMQEEWDEFVADTNDIPADFHFTKRPLRLWFKASTWASNVADAVAKRLTPSAIGAEGWRAIESAPKDGTHVLLRVKPFEWKKVNGGGGFKSDVTMTGYWDEMDGAWCGTTSNWDGPFVEPFAWQPLPTPPTAQEGK